MGQGVAEHRLERALAEQARLTARYQESVGTSGELSAYWRLQSATKAVRNCDLAMRTAARRASDRRGGSALFAFPVLLGLDGPRTARAEVARRVRGVIDAGVMKTLALLVSETVTNAIMHGAAAGTGTVDVNGEVYSDRLRVEVTNRGPAFEHTPVCPEGLEPDGRGLFLVDQLSRAWGKEHVLGKTRVWFEVDC